MRRVRLVFTPMVRRVPANMDEGCPFLVGHVYQRKLPGLSGRPSFRVTEPPRIQRLSEVTHRGAIEEGQEGRRALDRWRLQWVRANDRGWKRAHPTASDAEIMRRWRTHHAERYCWRLELDLLDPVRCMAEQRDILAGRTQHGMASMESDQYVASGGIDPHAEAVDPAEVTRLTASTLAQRLTRTERRQARRHRLFGSGQT